MKLIASMMLTLDGVYQGPGGPMRTDEAGSTAAGGPRRSPTARLQGDGVRRDDPDISTGRAGDLRQRRRVTRSRRVPAEGRRAKR
jgi:hypothetical protein